MAIINRDNVDSATIEEYATDIAGIWGERDLARPVMLHWLNVVKHATFLIEEVRKKTYDKIVLEIAEVFVWWLSFINRINFTIPEDTPSSSSELDLTNAVLSVSCEPSDIIWNKFPGCCPVCYGFALAEAKNLSPTSENDEEFIAVFGDLSNDELEAIYDDVVENKECSCLGRKSAVENRSKQFKKFIKQVIPKVAQLERGKKPNSLFEIERMIKEVFKPSIDVFTEVEIVFHLLEEIGEVSEAIADIHLQPNNIDHTKFLKEHRSRIANMLEELADVFSWIVSMREKAYYILNCSVNYLENEHRAIISMPSEKRNDKEALIYSSIDFFKRNVEKSSSISRLVWDVYASEDSSHMCCEGCKERPCNYNSEAHQFDSGHLFGADIIQYYEIIRNVEPFE